MSRSLLPVLLLACVAGVAMKNSCLAADASPLRPLDVKTRCIVLLREVLVDLHNRNIKQAAPLVADGHAENEFFVMPADAIKDMSEKDEAQFLGEFPNLDVLFTKFGEIRFSDVATDPVRVTVKLDKKDSGRRAALYLMKIQVPGLSDPTYQELRFIEVEDRLYWVPFGW